MRHAAESGNFVRIDMEDSSCTSDTLRMYRELREEGLDNVGVVLQAYLRRTIRDIRELAPLRPNIRLCKGIYIEPPLIAYRDFDAVRQNFVLCLRELLRGGSYVGIATHDKWLISEGQRLVAEHGLKPEEYEFQMLLGVTPAAGDRLIQRPSATGLRSLRQALVQLLDAAAAGEPEDRGLHRGGHGRPAIRPQRRVTLCTSNTVLLGSWSGI